MDYAEDAARCNTNNEDCMLTKNTVRNEETIYEEVHVYLSQGRYPLEATKQEKCTIRKRAKNFQLLDGVLHYKGKRGSLRQVSSIATIFLRVVVVSSYIVSYIILYLMFMLVIFRWFLIMERSGKSWKPAITML